MIICLYANIDYHLIINGIVEEFMIAVQTQGVVHLDWYPSNFMWKIDSNSNILVVKIIDFDSAHIIGDTLTEVTNMRLHGT